MPLPEHEPTPPPDALFSGHFAPAPMRLRDDDDYDPPTTASAPARERIEPVDSDLVSPIIADEMRYIQGWARDNQRDAQQDRIHFWMLKIPAILGGLGASALESFGYGTAVIVLGFLTAVCVAVDGLHPRGRLYNVHKRAANELFALQDRLATAWNQIKLQTLSSNKQRQLVAKTIAEIQHEKQRISQYITNAEASLGEQDRPAGG